MILFCLIVLCSQLTVAWTQACDRFTFPSEITVTEGTQNGTCIRTLSQADDVESVYFSSPVPPPFLHVHNGSLCLNDTLNLDSDKELCTYLETNGLWVIYVACLAENTPQGITIKVKLTDDFPPEFNSNFTKEVQELVLPQTSVLTLSSTDITDPDCNANLQLSVNTLFSIEGGNTNGAFELANERSGNIRVARWLDYENGDQHFLLNMSIAHMDKPDEKSYTTLEVKVKDIDDNDPVFNNSFYTVQVTEEDNSAVNVWRETDLPVAVFDPDVDVQPQEELSVSLYNASDVSKVKVNGTGWVSLQTTFDREQMSEFTVVLKVEQTQSSWRSSTVTLTVIVDDINDNRPQFDPSDYNFAIAEHAAPLTSVGLVFATDIDTGDNAKFNYTLLSHADIFKVDTINGGQIGVLRVVNSTLLDREVSPQLTVRIGTTEWTAKQGGDCSSGHCEADVFVTLVDINDHSPAFDQDSYNATVLSSVPHDVILTVHATDQDEGPNADVRYFLTSQGSGACDDVAVNETSGDVSMGHTITQSRQCWLLVKACDSPVSQQRRCTSVPLLIDVQVSNHTVVWSTSVPADLLTPHVAEIERKLGSILGVKANISNIVSDPVSEGSNIFVTATNTTTQDTLPRAALQQLLNDNRGEVTALFLSYLPITTTMTMTTTTIVNENEEQTGDNDFPPHVIALIVIAAVLLIALVVAIIVIIRGHKSEKRQTRLIQRLSTTNDIYINAELGKADSLTSPILPTDIEEGESGRERLGVTNPIFQDDDDDNSNGNEPLPTITPRSDTEDESLQGKETEVGTTQSKLPSRWPDADSGVPSDRENGAGESDSSPDASQDTSPILGRGEGGGGGGGGDGSVREVGGANYLNAVLSDLFMASPDDNPEVGNDNNNDDDMVDVTSPLPLYGNAQFDLHADHQYVNFPNQHAETKIPSPQFVHTSRMMQHDDHQKLQDSVQGAGNVASHHIPEDATEEVEKVMTFSDETGETFPSSSDPARALGALLHQSLTSEKQQDTDRGHDKNNDEEEEEEEGFESKLGRMVRPCTPPMRKSGAGEELEEADEDSLPEEPLPDYAKKVRFSIQSLQYIGDHQDDKGEDDGEHHDQDDNEQQNAKNNDDDDDDGDADDPEKVDDLGKNADPGQVYDPSNDVKTDVTGNGDGDTESGMFSSNVSHSDDVTEAETLDRKRWGDDKETDKEGVPILQESMTAF